MGQEDEQRLEEGMCCAILSQGHEVVRLGYSMMSCAAAMGKDKDRHRDNPYRFTWVMDKGKSQITHTGLPGLAVEISSGQIMQNRLSGLETRASNSQVRVSNTQITQIRSEMRGSRGVGCRRCVKESWLRKGKKNNGISCLTG
jgi:hypothetical protein